MTVRSADPAFARSNDSDHDWGCRLVGHPLSLNYVCRHAQRTRQPRRTERPTQTDHNPTRTTSEKNKKKTRRGGDLGVEVELGVRVEDGVRVQGEETQGEPQTPKGVWVSPAPEREKERKRRRRTSPQQEREREKKKKKRTTNTNANKGQVLKGTKPNNISTPKTNKNHTNHTYVDPVST